MSRTTSSNDISQTFSLEEDNDGAEGTTGGTTNASGTPADLDDVSPNQVMGRLKLLKQEVLEQHGLRPIYKSYSNWEKMTAEQRNKAVAWFRKLPEPLRGKLFFIPFLFPCWLFLYCWLFF